jgi:hypothetical protein
MITNFNTLFTLAVSRSYYRSPCEDFDFSVLGETARLLRNGKLLSKVRGGVLYILFETDESDGPLVRLDGRTLRFGLLLKNPSFRNFTHVPWEQTMRVVYRNGSSPLAFDAPEAAMGETGKEADRNGLFGVVELRIDAAFYTSPAAFVVSFDAKEEELRYYIVARKYTESDISQLSLSDEGYGDDERARVTFLKIEGLSLADDTTACLLKTSTDSQVILFRSQGLVTRRKEGRRKIRLSRNGDTIIANMPQPGQDSANSNMTVYISKP